MRERLNRLLDTLDRRKDAEHEVAIARFVLLAGWLICIGLIEGFAGDGQGHPATWVAALALAGAIAIMGSILHTPRPLRWRRHVAIVLDQAFLAVSLHLLGDEGAVLVPFFLLVAVANALLFDRGTGIVAGLAGVIGYASVLATAPGGWAAAGTHARVILLMIALTSFHVSVASHRMRGVSEVYRVRARRMARIAMEDPLTRLANRTYFRQSLKRALVVAQQGAVADAGFAVVYCDLDNFKRTNDVYGHPIGDAVLRSVASALRASVRASDVVARLGGDEFAVFLKGITDAQIASRICASMLSGVADIREAGGASVEVACSIGVTLFVAPIAPTVDVDRVLMCADEAMFQAKRDGKGRFHLCVAAL